MTTKSTMTCSKCKNVLSIDNFSEKRRQCNRCIADYQREYRKQNEKKLKQYLKNYYEENKEKKKKDAKNYYWNHLEVGRAARKAWIEKNKKRAAEQQKRWRKNNRDRYNRVRKEYFKNNLSAHIGSHVRKTIHSKIKNANGKKAETSIKILGCSINDLRKYIESLWVIGMSWENYGVWKKNKPMTWHIDHIKPCASFDLTDPEQQKICFHWSNLQPLWAIDNIKKGDKF